jgi:hypothetical protein
LGDRRRRRAVSSFTFLWRFAAVNEMTQASDRNARWRQRLAALRALAARPVVRRTLGWLRWGLLAAVIVYLAIRLSALGWSELARSLPQTPWFYLIFELKYFATPLSEIPAYEIVWRRPLWRHVQAFLRKRVYNFAVMGYSGEAFFTLWARRTLNLSDGEIVRGVKDNNLISALVSNTATALIVIGLFVNGRLAQEIDAIPGGAVLFALGFGSAALLATAVLLFRKTLMPLPPGVLPRLIAINGLRMIVVMGLQTLLYATAIPGAPLGAWAMFVALQLVLSRLPFVPNPDILFLTAALSLAATIDAPEAQVAGMLVAEAGLAQLLNAVLFVVTAHLAFAGGKREAA